MYECDQLGPDADARGAYRGGQSDPSVVVQVGETKSRRAAAVAEGAVGPGCGRTPPDGGTDGSIRRQPGHRSHREALPAPRVCVTHSNQSVISLNRQLVFLEHTCCFAIVRVVVFGMESFNGHA